jgi:hypothetical protein
MEEETEVLFPTLIMSLRSRRNARLQRNDFESVCASLALENVAGGC